MSENNRQSSGMPDPFDRQLAGLIDLPDVVKAGPVVKRTVPIFGIGGSSIYVVQTIRQGAEHIVFLEVVDAEGTKRIVIPAEVSDTIARQRETCSVLLRRKLSRQSAADRKARGIQPGFMKNPGRGRRKAR